jgi:hypothetical protein
MRCIKKECRETKQLILVLTLLKQVIPSLASVLISISFNLQPILGLVAC